MLANPAPDTSPAVATEPTSPPAPIEPPHLRPVNGSKSRFSQIIAMQRELLKVVMDPKVSARERASCAIAWDKLEDRTRILRGKPLPGQYRPEVKAKPKALLPWSGPTEA